MVVENGEKKMLMHMEKEEMQTMIQIMKKKVIHHQEFVEE